MFLELLGDISYLCDVIGVLSRNQATGLLMLSKLADTRKNSTQ